MVMNAEHRNIRSPSPAMVTSQYEWQILEWDDKTQTNKQTLPIACEILPSVELIHYGEHVIDGGDLLHRFPWLRRDTFGQFLLIWQKKIIKMLLFPFNQCKHLNYVAHL